MTEMAVTTVPVDGCRCFGRQWPTRHKPVINWCITINIKPAILRTAHTTATLGTVHLVGSRLNDKPMTVLFVNRHIQNVYDSAGPAYCQPLSIDFDMTVGLSYSASFFESRQNEVKSSLSNNFEAICCHMKLDYCANSCTTSPSY